MIIQEVNVANVINKLLNGITIALESSEENKIKEIEKVQEDIKEYIQLLNFNKLSENELRYLGFSKFSSEDTEMLIPIWIFKYLPDGIRVRSIMGNVKTIGTDKIDADVRGGMLAFKLIQED